MKDLLSQRRDAVDETRNCTDSGKSKDPRQMAALPPATVILNGFRKTSSLSGIRADVRAEGMNSVPTAAISASSRLGHS